MIRLVLNTVKNIKKIEVTDVIWNNSWLADKNKTCAQAILTTDNTSISILLNSSKQAQAPELASPLKNLPIAIKSSWSEQLKTTHCLAIALAKSLVVSVLPVPAGPVRKVVKLNC